ncbi:MAG: hypothetical protein JNK86_00455 [Alphaproteobacteria bacterium]|nr:hypothetical protein [Alphaproteobacteria bacterium]
MQSNQQQYWFRVKEYGYGAYPVSIQGWLCLLMFLGIYFADIFWIVSQDSITITKILVAIAVFLLALGGLVWIARKKSNKPWRWRSSTSE